MRRLFLLPVLFFFLGYTHARMSLDQQYRLLQQRPAYKDMSFLQIAAERDDFEAIRHFTYAATLDDLYQAKAVLDTKLDFLERDLQKTAHQTSLGHIVSDLNKDTKTPQKTAIGKASLRQDKDAIKKKMGHLQNIRQNMSRRIEALKPSQGTSA